MNLKEKFNLKAYEKMFERINLEDFFELIKTLSSKEAYVNKGDFSKVYRDLLNQSCYKVLTRPDQIRNAKEEADILNDVKDLNNLNLGRVPVPLFSIMPIRKLEEDHFLKNGAFAMQFVDGARLKDIIDKKESLPKNFELENSFDKLYFLIEVMHKEKQIFHRDIHAGNIMVENKTGTLYLIDFGNAIKLSTDAIKNRVDPYHLVIKNRPFDLLDDFDGLEKTKKEIRNFLTKK